MAAVEKVEVVVAHHERATLRVGDVFVDVDEITGVVDWSEAGQGDALYDLASLTLGHREHLGHVVAG
jgi:aminoglycoside phosphotransferase (APT) family kinase protein